MGKLKAFVMQEEQKEELVKFIATHSFTDYQFYRMLDHEGVKKYFYDQILGFLGKKAKWLIGIKNDGNLSGLVSLDFLPWDTMHFGMRTGRIGHLIIDKNKGYKERLEIGNYLFTYLFFLCKEEKIKYLSFRIDINDTLLIHALETNGFKLMDSIVTYAAYLHNKHRRRILELKDLCKVRVARESDMGGLIEISAKSFSNDRFHLDPRIPNKKADGVFVEWIKGACEGKNADKVLVAERKKRIVGFVTYLIDRELEARTGFRIAGRGLSAVLPGVKGIYPSLVKAAMQDLSKNADIAEFDTQLNNYEVLKIWHRFGLGFVKARHTFHLWLE
ncbi:MAG: hypothetical protein ISS47_09375 [Candidatus Omnitrophica bacterium]|nr:hypothetical protein [Candidatus Omnitrophota bacterium]